MGCNQNNRAAEQLATADGNRASLSLVACNPVNIPLWKGTLYWAKMVRAQEQLQAPSLRSARMPPLSSGVRWRRDLDLATKRVRL
jgi:hypothetical protein